MRSSYRLSHPSGLARQLARALPAGVSPDAPRQDVAERLGQWLNVAEAVELHAAQPAVTAAGAAAARRPPRTEPAALHATLSTELDRVRAVLARSITTAPAHKPDPDDLDTEFALFHQRLGDQQRRMEMSVDSLREHVRQQLAQSTPAMAQLAATDAVMDGFFGGREQRLLSTLPAFLKARFAALRREAAQAREPDTPDDLRWLQSFAAEFEQTLLAELDLRLQPVTGLIEALAHEH
ncbi:DUF3348 family protein [Hydrogenophaga pseudoflava]|uniref:DUF3348 family protein n=1 Tax=Hydrogenophaga pseudoflava TaxID=47421 RepID=UPI0027E3B5C2|nr:DUF3348 family protein [Hydrogenophaga pseudoflava]MDQ7744739.1 DUF3348 family protein [Hydrogenophaga pseudoflava]